MLLFSIIFFFLTTAYGYDQLPGIDDIAVSYDAVKMSSINKRNPKYRLFDLSEESSIPFKMKISDEIRTKRAIQPTPEEAKNDGLCPYSGYQGKECLGQKATGRALVPENTPKMPVGVGMSFDITSGKLLLPALKYSYPRINQWNDIVTNVTYQMPRGITSLPINDEDNDPIIRVFLTAAELSNEWKYEKLRGSWSGGEFGHSKSLLDIYKKYFSNNQAIAITQKPTVLYRLRVENIKLNPYVIKALKNLSTTYNEIAYNNFINAWGTHIVTQSLIGGSHEQQVLFKDCVFSFNGAITSDNLTEYLKQDLLKETLGNSFYANRRKISIDHSLGGRPNEQNETRWRETLVDNPALLKIEEYTSWSDIIQIDPDIRANLKKIIDIRTAAADKTRVDEENQVTQQRVNGSYMAREGSIGLVNNGSCDIIPTTFGPIKSCLDGCPTNVLVNGGNDFLDDQQLWYETDETTGFIRARERIDAQTIMKGPRVLAGCSSIYTPTKSTISAHICVSCDLVNSFADQCVCVCPAYPSPTGT